jgi:anti-anti-sigma factor
LYRSSNGDITLLEISMLGAEPVFQDEQAIRLAVAGEIDIMAADGLRDTLIQTLHKYRPVHIDVNLADVTFMDASGVTALLKFAIAAHQLGCAVSITNPQSGAQKVLEITGLLDEFDSPPTDRVPRADTGTVADGQPALARSADVVVDAYAGPR